MTLKLVGLNYRQTPLALRERFTIALRELPAALESIRRGSSIDETVILSTCNRVELYVTSSTDEEVVTNELLEFLSHHSRLEVAAFRAHIYTMADREAIAHLFRVTAGLDSAILGESEVTAQVKDAYRVAHAQGTTGAVLNPLFQKALHSAKQIRSKTAIGEGHASIGSVVVGLVQRIFADQLAACEVLLWGAGKAAEATARHLIKTGVRQLWIVNRTQPKAEDLALLCQSGWLSWEQALKHLAHVDIAIVCTQAPHYVIDAADLDAVSAERQGRPLCLIDLAVPRNIDPVLRTKPAIQLYDIDDLQAMTQEAITQRQHALVQGDQLIGRQVDQIWARWHAVAQREAAACALSA